MRVISLPDTDAEIAKIVLKEAVVNTIREQGQRYAFPSEVVSQVLGEVVEMYDRESERKEQ
jgi:hypothetical protein